MTTNIYSIKDTKIGFRQPFLQQNDAVAARTAKWMANEKKDYELEDQELWKLGTFNDETGIITPIQPAYLYNLIELKDKTHVKEKNNE